MQNIQITNDTHQGFFINYRDLVLEFDIRFLATISKWIMTVLQDGVTVVSGISLQPGGRLLSQQNYNYDFFVDDTTERGVAPMLLNDFSSGRVNLIMLEDTDLETIRA